MQSLWEFPSETFRPSPVEVRAHWVSKLSWETTLKRYFLDFLSDDSGATAIEYGLIAAGISLAIIAVVNGLGTNLNGTFASINNSLK